MIFKMHNFFLFPMHSYLHVKKHHCLFKNRGQLADKQIERMKNRESLCEREGERQRQRQPVAIFKQTYTKKKANSEKAILTFGTKSITIYQCQEQHLHKVKSVTNKTQCKYLRCECLKQLVSSSSRSSSRSSSSTGSCGGDGNCGSGSGSDSSIRAVPT